MTDKSNKPENGNLVNQKTYWKYRIGVGLLLALAGCAAAALCVLGFLQVLEFETWISFVCGGIAAAALAFSVWFFFVSAKAVKTIRDIGKPEQPEQPQQPEKAPAAVIAPAAAGTEQEAEKTAAAGASATEKLSAERVMGKKNIKAVSRKQIVAKVFVQIGLYAFLTLIAVTILFPFYWMLISSVKTITEYELRVPTFWPRTFKWDNYLVAFTGDLQLGRLFLNTVIVGVVSTILSLVITVLSAYAFARLEFRGKNIIFAFMLATMMIPGELFTVTNYVTVTKLSWTNTFTALIVPFLVSVFYIYLLRQNFMQIPNELYLAAKVDGTSDLKYLWRVMIPLSAPTLISITILKMMGAWNSYIWPNLVAKDLPHRLITVGLRGEAFYDEVMQTTNMPAQMAAIVLVTVPLLLVFMFFRKYIMRGVSRSGIKG